MLAMVRNPDVVKQAQEEIDQVIGRDRMPTLEDRESLPYINCILKETLRWNPPTPLGMITSNSTVTISVNTLIGIPHRLMETDTYNGMQIPGGSTIIPNLW